MRYCDLAPYDWVYIVGRPNLDAPPFYSSGIALRLRDMEAASGFKPRVFGVLHDGLFDAVVDNEKF